MEGLNLTPFPAMLLRTVVDEQRMSASMLTRVTYDISGETLTPADEQTWLVDVDERDTPLGAMNGDQPYRKDGVDLFVIGATASTKGGVAAPRVDLRVEVGAFEATAVAFGPRVWKKVGNALVPSDPEPFVSLPLGWEAAFGGTVLIDDLDTPFPFNGRGVGLYVDEAAAEGKALPRLEDPAALVTRWDDKPYPVGFGLCQFPEGLRLLESGEFVDNELKTFRSRMFNQAFPKMIAPAVSPGDRVVLDGFAPEGRTTFVVPDTRLFVRLQLGEKIVERPLVIEELGVDLARRQAFIGYRYPFRYVFVPEVVRICTLALGGN